MIHGTDTHLPQAEREARGLGLFVVVAYRHWAPGPGCVPFDPTVDCAWLSERGPGEILRMLAPELRGRMVLLVGRKVASIFGFPGSTLEWPAGDWYTLPGSIDADLCIAPCLAGIAEDSDLLRWQRRFAVSILAPQGVEDLRDILSRLVQQRKEALAK